MTDLTSDDPPDQELAGSARRTGWWRTAVAAILIVVAAGLAPLAVVATWAHDEIGDTDRYLQMVTPLASNPAVQDAIVDRVTGEIFSRLDVKALTQQAVAALADRGLPTRVATGLDALTTPVADGVRDFITTRVTRIVESREFADAWVLANRGAHVQLIALLTGHGTDTVQITGDAVQVNLAAVIDLVKLRLVDSGFSLAARLPTVNAQFTIVHSGDLTKAQKGFSALSASARWLPILALLALAAAVYVARNRRRALLAGALAVAGGLLALDIALNVFRVVYLDAVPADQLSSAAAAAVYDALAQFIRFSLRAVLVVALAIAVGAWLTGPSSAAVATRKGISGAAGAVRGGAEHVGVTTGPVGVFVYRYRVPIRAVVIGSGLLFYVAADHPTGSWMLEVLAFIGVVLLVVEVVGRPPKPGFLSAREEPIAGGRSV